MKSAITIRLDRDLEKALDKVCVQTGRSRSDIVRDALRRQLSLLRFEQLRRKTMPFAEARGYLTDEDVFDVRRLARLGNESRLDRSGRGRHRPGGEHGLRLESQGEAAEGGGAMVGAETCRTPVH